MDEMPNVRVKTKSSLCLVDNIYGFPVNYNLDLPHKLLLFGMLHLFARMTNLVEIFKNFELLYIKRCVALKVL